MKKCLHCGNEIEQKEGKREKLYCGSTCRSAHFQKNKGGEKKYIQIKTHKKEVEMLKKELEELRFKVAKNNEPENKKRILANRELSTMINYKNPLSENECYDGKKFDNNFVSDEAALWQEPTEKEEAAIRIAEYQKELSELGVGSIATQRRKFIEGKIKLLQRKL